MLLMALSNKFGWLVLTTGNKSEMAVGYSTLYGDTAGGFAGHQGRAQDAGLQERCATQRPGRASAGPESRSSPSHPRRSCAPTSATTSRFRPTRCSTRSSRPTWRTTARRPSSWRWASTLVGARVTRLVDLSEYKRRQTPPGVRATTKAFGKDRRLPITNRYRG